MSVLYKALQKAAKENEQQASDQDVTSAVPEGSSFDPQRMAGARSISGSRFGSGGNNLKLAGGAAAVVLLLVVVGVFFLGDSDEPAQVVQAPSPPAAETQPTPVPDASAPEAPQTPMDVARAAADSSSASTTPSPVMTDGGVSGSGMSESATDTEELASSNMSLENITSAGSEATASIESASTPLSSAPAVEQPANGMNEGQTEVAQAAVTPSEAPSAAVTLRQNVAPTGAPAPAAAAPRVSDPMPKLDVNSPARVLSPPISIRRAEAEFAGIGDMVRVREVSQSAQDNVTAGYNALVRGDNGAALELYGMAVESEPTSVMAQLGRSASLQKLGRMDEARTGYENVLRLDPNNREALTNLTSIYSARAPNEALNRLLDLEREYPSFSPVKAQIGLLYARMGSSAEALAYLRQAAAMSPATVMYQYNLAVLLDRLGRAEQAVVSYERVLAGILNGGVASDLSRAGIERRVRYLKTL